jgi:hypothetical protein
MYDFPNRGEDLVIPPLSLVGVYCFTHVRVFVSPINYRENRWGYFTEIWFEDTYGQYDMLFHFCNLTYFLAFRRPSWKSGGRAAVNNFVSAL